MDVEDQFLGQQVRCPHCRQIVQTQAPLPPSVPPPPDRPPPEITFTALPTDGEESIFGAPEQENDDLFGNAEMPRLELPANPAPGPSPVDIPPTEVVPLPQGVHKLSGD